MTDFQNFALGLLILSVALAVLFGVAYLAACARAELAAARYDEASFNNLMRIIHEARKQPTQLSNSSNDHTPEEPSI